MSGETKHAPTPGPWHADGCKVRATNTSIVVCLPSPDSGVNVEQAIANAAFIVRACNSHDALVAALEKALEVIKVWHACDEVWDIYLNHSPELKPVVAALKSAKGAA